MTNDESQMTKEIRRTKHEKVHASSFVLRHLHFVIRSSFGFRHSSFPFASRYGWLLLCTGLLALSGGQLPANLPRDINPLPRVLPPSPSWSRSSRWSTGTVRRSARSRRTTPRSAGRAFRRWGPTWLSNGRDDSACGQGPA